jgi:hypothetical protein
VFLRLKAEFNWYELFHDLIEDFDVDALAQRQAAGKNRGQTPILPIFSVPCSGACLLAGYCEL